MMVQARPTNRSGLRLAALLALSAVALVGTPRSSRADCSHPERPSLALDLGGVGRDLATLAGSIASPPRIDPTSPERPKPCSGPQCSGKSAPASSPATVPGSRSATADAWATLAARLALDTPRPGFLASEDRPVSPRLTPSSIFHPPRHAS